MTTHVPDGTPDETVDAIRAREAARARELAAEGHLVRLWRPPLQPGEWRSLGLFEAGDEEELEKVLASMPLRVWRTDDVTPLSLHANDPGSARTGATPAQAEFLTTFNLTVPAGTPGQTVDDTKTREAARARALSEEGHLSRLWILPAPAGQSLALGLWRAKDAAAMQAILESLPLYAWMTVETTPLSEHPNDPAIVEEPQEVDQCIQRS
jgi:muconolactone delta-isomerase